MVNSNYLCNVSYKYYVEQRRETPRVYATQLLEG